MSNTFSKLKGIHTDSQKDVQQHVRLIPKVSFLRDCDNGPKKVSFIAISLLCLFL